MLFVILIIEVHKNQSTGGQLHFIREFDEEHMPKLYHSSSDDVFISIHICGSIAEKSTNPPMYEHKRCSIIGDGFRHM